jgi:small subunit ribosomal protein S16
MLMIRLQRVGRKNIPAFRVVLTDSKNSTKSGKYLEVLGNFEPIKNVKVVDGVRIKHWISKGAQLSDTMHNFLIDQKIITGKKINKLPKKTPIKKDAPAEAAAPKEAAPAAETPAPAEAPVA